MMMHDSIHTETKIAKFIRLSYMLGAVFGLRRFAAMIASMFSSNSLSVTSFDMTPPFPVYIIHH